MFHTKNLTFIINVLLDNDYSLIFIFDTVNQRIKKLLKNKHTVRKDLVDNVCAKKQKYSLNLQTDTEGFHKAYILPILNKV